MESSLLSRVCSRQLVATLDLYAINGWEPERIRLSFVRDRLPDGQRSDISHVVFAEERADGIRGATRFCLCRQVENPNYDPR